MTRDSHSNLLGNTCTDKVSDTTSPEVVEQGSIETQPFAGCIPEIADWFAGGVVEEDVLTEGKLAIAEIPSLELFSQFLTHRNDSRIGVLGGVGIETDDALVEIDLSLIRALHGSVTRGQPEYLGPTSWEVTVQRSRNHVLGYP